MGVDKSNGDIRILTASLEKAVSAHAQYKVGQKQARMTGETSGRLQVAMQHSCHFTIVSTVINVDNCGPEVLFETCVTMKFVDDDDDDDDDDNNNNNNNNNNNSV